MTGFCTFVTVNFTVTKLPKVPRQRFLSFQYLNQHLCDQIWGYFATWGKCKQLSPFFNVQIGIFNLLWRILFAIGQIFSVVNGQILNKKSCHLGPIS